MAALRAHSCRDATTGFRTELGGCARSIGPRGPIPKGDKIVELDLVIAALQTFAVLFLVSGAYLATRKTGGSQISAEAASSAPARAMRERIRICD